MKTLLLLIFVPLWLSAQSFFVPVMLNIDEDSFPKALGKTHFTPILYSVDPISDAVLAQFTGYAAKDEFLYYLKKGE